MGRDRHILRDFCAYACVIAVLNFGCLVMRIVGDFHLYALCWWPIVSEFVFSQRQQSFSASMHGNNNLFDLNDGGVSQVTRMCDVSENYVYRSY